MQTEISHNEIADIKHKLRMHNTQPHIIKKKSRGTGTGTDLLTRIMVAL